MNGAREKVGGSGRVGSSKQQYVSFMVGHFLLKLFGRLAFYLG